MDEKHCVCSFDVFIPLGEAADFFCIGVASDGAVAALTELAIFGDFAGVGVDCMSEVCDGHAIRLVGAGRLRGTCVVKQ
jgi:hypothetical protein